MNSDGSDRKTDPRVEGHVAKAMALRVEPINQHRVALYELVGVLAAVRDGDIGVAAYRPEWGKKLEEAR